MGNKASRDALEGRGAVITGANSGAGLAITKKLLDYGMTVIGVDAETDKLDELKEETNDQKLIHVVKADITDEEEILDAFQWISDNVQNVDVLINSAEDAQPCSILGGNEETWQQMANTNIIGMCSCTIEMLRTMKEQNIDLGLIVIVNNVAGHQVATSSKYHFYSATKHATTRITEHLRQELEFSSQPVKITSVTIGPNEFVSANEDYTNEFFETRGNVEMGDITSAIDYIVHTPAHVQVRDIHIIPIGNA